MSFEVRTIPTEAYAELAKRDESHFFELKSADRFEPIGKTLSAFGNAEGGRLIVGASDKNSVRGEFAAYADQEHANGHIAEITKMFSLAPEALDINFLKVDGQPGLLLDIEVGKSAPVVSTPDGRVFVRLNAANRELKGQDVQHLAWRKGQASYEDVKTEEDVGCLAESDVFERFKGNLIPEADGAVFLNKEKLGSEGKATVAGVLLFDDAPQATITQSAIKLYRYRSVEKDGDREALAGDPVTVEGPAHTLIYDAVQKTTQLIESIEILGEQGFEQIKYPPEAIHEVICNAVIHRDYAVHDYIHIRVFDNRVEIESPGKLPGHITKKNILKQRFARNKRVVRILNKFPDPPNKDVGEGLDTTFRTMRAMNLKDPQIDERESSVCVILAHEPLASKEKLIQSYLERHGTINNATGRDICFEPSESRMRKIYQKMILAGVLERVPESRGKGAKYRLKTD